MSSNAESLLALELRWLDRVLQARLSLHFGLPTDVQDVRELEPPQANDDSAYARFLSEAGCGFEERLLLILALAPHVQPQLLDPLFVRNRNLDRGYTEFGGTKGKVHGGFLPTCETAVFLLAGANLALRLAALKLFDHEHWLQRSGIFSFDHDAPGEPPLATRLQLQDEFRELLTTGQHHKPDFGSNFPARLMTTALLWEDLVLPPEVMDDLTNITIWLNHDKTLLDDWNLRKVVKPGYRSLFFGAPGTGKTLTATLLGQATGTDVYRIDLSRVVGKYIGETEKNLGRVFDLAQDRRWILFLDEADALFGKRDSASCHNDRHADHEVSYLLQRVDDFAGTVIMATDLKGNIDEAFAKRFQSLIHFPMPDAEQRLRLWEGTLRHTGHLAAEVDLRQLAEAHEISGGDIANAVRAAAISALRNGRERVTLQDLHKGALNELRKKGRTVQS